MLLKIRIFTLAKELNMDSKVLLEYCQRLGIILKNSALASISPEEKDQVLALIKQGPPQGEAAKSEPLVPTREAPRVVSSKVPKIKTVAPRPQPGRKEKESEPAVVDEPAAPHGTEEGDVPESAPIAAEDRSSAKGAAAPAESETKLPPTEPEADRGTPPGNAPIPTPSRGPAPLRREDYLPASGTTRGPQSRELPDLGPRLPRRPKGRPGPQLPKLAEPPPSPKTAGGPGSPSAEAPAQKPDLRLPRDVIAERKPLQEHLRQHAEEKKKKKHPDGTEDFTEEVVKRPPGKGGGPSKVAPAAAAGMGLLSERKQRQARRTKGPGLMGEEEEGGVATSRMRPQRLRTPKRVHAPMPLKSSAVIDAPITVRSLSEAMGRPSKELLRFLMGRGVMATVNSAIDEETAMELAMEVGVELEVKHGRDIEQEIADAVEARADGAQLAPRAPIVTILGHVDHGKTTLLDKIRSTDVAAGEVGGITQHIAAHQVEHNGRKITFLDTPGHAAFGEMRARGANVTDIAVLVVAANDGVMPQTIEAINHAKSAGVPIVVALNKSDLPDKNEQRVLQELAQHNILAAEWGGDTEVVRTSGLTGLGLEDLLETLLTVAELKELTADADRPAHGVCLEAFLSEGRGVLAWLIVQEGTLRKGDVLLCGAAYGRIRNIYNDHDQEIEEAGPSMPVKIAGLDIMPGAGDHFVVLGDLEEARTAAASRRDRGREAQLNQRGKPRTLQEILDAAQTGGVQELPLIVKADTPGSVEALKGELHKFQHPEVRVNILHDGVGGVNESDVYLASAAGAIVVAFHVVPEDRAQALADREGVEIRKYGIIYEVTDDIKKALEGMLRPEQLEVPTGRALVLQTFNISRFGTIAGCRVLNGVIERTNRVHVIRDQRVLNDYNIGSLKRNKDDVKEVRDGLECGIRLENFNDVKEGDIFQAYKIEEIKRTL